jgi:hypothetical protein
MLEKTPQPVLAASISPTLDSLAKKMDRRSTRRYRGQGGPPEVAGGSPVIAVRAGGGIAGTVGSGDAEDSPLTGIAALIMLRAVRRAQSSKDLHEEAHPGPKRMHVSRPTGTPQRVILAQPQRFAEEVMLSFTNLVTAIVAGYPTAREVSPAARTSASCELTPEHKAQPREGTWQNSLGFQRHGTGRRM